MPDQDGASKAGTFDDNQASPGEHKAPSDASPKVDKGAIHQQIVASQHPGAELTKTGPATRRADTASAPTVPDLPNLAPDADDATGLHSEAEWQGMLVPARSTSRWSSGVSAGCCMYAFAG